MILQRNVSFILIVNVVFTLNVQKRELSNAEIHFSKFIKWIPLWQYMAQNVNMIVKEMDILKMFLLSHIINYFHAISRIKINKMSVEIMEMVEMVEMVEMAEMVEMVEMAEMDVEMVKTTNKD